MNGNVVLSYTYVVQFSQKFTSLMGLPLWTSVSDNFGWVLLFFKLRYSLWNRKWVVLSHKCVKNSINIKHCSLGEDENLNYILQVIGSQCKDLITAVMCSVFLVFVRTLAKAFIVSWSCWRQKSLTVVKSYENEGWMSFCKPALDIRSLILHICLRW